MEPPPPNSSSQPPNSSPQPIRKKLFGKILKNVFQGGSSSGGNQNEEQQIPAAFDFPQNVEEYGERALSPVNAMHISDSSMDIHDKLRFTVRCRMGTIHKWWGMMEERGPTFASIRETILGTPFGHLLRMPRGNCDKHLLFALLERWWPTTHTFHFPGVEMGFTPLDFTCLTGLSVGRGEVVPFDSRYDSGEFDVSDIFPTLFSDDSLGKLKTKSGIKLQFFSAYFMDPTSLEYSHENGVEPLLIAPGGDEEREYIYAFLLYLVGGSFFASAHNSIHMGWMAGLVDIQAIGKYDWGGAIMAHLYRCMDDFVTCGNELKQLTGFTWILQFWWYEYLGTCQPVLKSLPSDTYPRVLVWSKSNQCRVIGNSHNSYAKAKEAVELKTRDNINWWPWVTLEVREEMVDAGELSKCRVILVSPEVQAWYLGDRCVYQTMTNIAIPFPPPQNMRADDLTLAQQTIHKPNSWPSAQNFVISCNPQAYEQYWRRVSRGSLFISQVERIGNIDIMRASALRPEVRIPYHVDPTVSQEHYPISHIPDPDEQMKLRVVGSRGLDTSVVVPIVDYSRVRDFAPDFYATISEQELRHRYACAVLREQGLREAAYDYSQQSYQWLQEARGINDQYAIESQANAGRIQELEQQVANMRIVIEDLEPRRRTRPRGRGRGGNASSHGSAHS